MTTKTTGYRYLAEALQAYGLTHVFMVPTIAVPALAEMDDLGLTGIMAHGEKAAVYMADGYARARGGPALCMAQTIGAANLAAGLRDPFMAGSPVIAMTGGTQPSTRYRHVYQEIEDFPLYDQVTKFNAYVDDVGRLPDLLRQAFREATSGAPGPVHLQLQGLSGEVLAGDITRDAAAGPLFEPAFASYPPFRPAAEASAVRAALEAIGRAERPIIVAGGGVTASRAGSEVVELARLLGIPVATSLNAKGIIAETDPLAVGVVGSYSRTSANQAVAQADLVFFVGSHTGSQVTDSWRLPGIGTPVVQLDLDPRELGRNYPNTVGLHGDARATVRSMLEMAASAAGEVSAARQAWLDRTRGFVEEWRRVQQPKFSSDQVPIRPERLCAELTAFLPDDAVLLSDTGHSGIWTGSMIELRPGQQYLRCAGSLGWALPATIGAKCAHPDRPVIGFTGDGGLYYHLAELETAVRHGINAVIVVNDNRSLSQDMAVFQRSWNGQTTEAADRMWMFTQIDLAAVAAGLGCASFRVESPGDIAQALKEATEAGRPALVDVVTETEALPERPHGGQDFYAKS
jgi:acetolactate synthase I/II/III large subunit